MSNRSTCPQTRIHETEVNNLRKHLSSDSDVFPSETASYINGSGRNIPNTRVSREDSTSSTLPLNRSYNKLQTPFGTPLKTETISGSYKYSTSNGLTEVEYTQKLNGSEVLWKQEIDNDTGEVLKSYKAEKTNDKLCLTDLKSKQRQCVRLSNDDSYNGKNGSLLKRLIEEYRIKTEKRDRLNRFSTAPNEGSLSFSLSRQSLNENGSRLNGNGGSLPTNGLSLNGSSQSLSANGNRYQTTLQEFLTNKLSKNKLNGEVSQSNGIDNLRSNTLNRSLYNGLGRSSDKRGIIDLLTGRSGTQGTTLPDRIETLKQTFTDLRSTEPVSKDTSKTLSNRIVEYLSERPTENTLGTSTQIPNGSQLLSTRAAGSNDRTLERSSRILTQPVLEELLDSPLDLDSIALLADLGLKYRKEGLEVLRRVIMEQIVNDETLSSAIQHVADQTGLSAIKLAKDVVDQIAVAIALNLPYTLNLDEARAINVAASRGDEEELKSVLGDIMQSLRNGGERRGKRVAL